MGENLNLENSNHEDEKKEKVIAGQKKRRKHKERLLLLLLLLLVTGVMFGTSTYAWFTSNKTVSVNDITVNVAAQNGIQLSVDGTTWKSVIQTADIQGASTKYAAAVNQIPNTVEPVSTIGEVDSTGKMKMFYGTITANEGTGSYDLTASQTTEVNGTEGKFIAFDLFFKVDQDTDIYMTNSSGVEAADSNDVGIQNASRIGFVVLGNKPAGTALGDIQSINAGASSPVYIWEPNYDVHTASGVTNANDTYGITTTETGAARITYDGVKADIAADANVDYKSANKTAFSDLFDTVAISYETPAAKQQFDMFSLTAGITKVRVYMWIEGQDVDCENNASGGQIVYNMQITAKTV